MVGMTGTPSRPESFPVSIRIPFCVARSIWLSGKDHRAFEFRELEREEEVPFKGGCINNVHDHIRVVVGNELAGDLLLGRECGDGIDAREIDHPDPLATVLEESLGPLNGLSRPVADLLVNTGELVEGRTLADIGISGKGNHVFAFVIRRVCGRIAAVTVPRTRSSGLLPACSDKDMVGNRMIDGKPGLPHADLNRAEKGGLADQLDIRFEGEPEIGEALHDAVVAPDKGNGGLLAGLEGGDRDQGLVPGTGGGRRVFLQDRQNSSPRPGHRLRSGSRGGTGPGH